MALAITTLSSAMAATDNQFVVASATGFAAGYVVKIDDEEFKVAQNYTSGTTIYVVGGKEGSARAAHAVTANVIVGTASDWQSAAVQSLVTYPIAGRSRTITSYTTTSTTLTQPVAGSDAVAILNGTAALAMTVAVPTKDMDGCIFFIIGNGKAAHTVTFTGGLGAGGASYDVATFDANGQNGIQVMACNAVWILLSPMTGTLTAAVPALA